MKAHSKLINYHMLAWIVILLIYSNIAFAKRPNIIVILTDDQRYDALSLYDTFPWLETPNIDRLANEGALFENAFVTTAVCGPSRASFLTGTYANHHGVLVNQYRDPVPTIPIFPVLLQDVGYQTAFIGKWHMAESTMPREGFSHWVSFSGQGKYYGNKLNVDGKSVESLKYITDELNYRALEFIRRKRNVPFALYLSHKAIHAPWVPATRHEKLYSEVEFSGFDNPNENFLKKPHWLRKKSINMRNGQGMSAEQRMNMLRTVSAVDEGIGQLIDELRKQNILDKTVIVFAADNGYFFGEHGNLSDKRNAYEESMRIPLILRYPPLVKSGTRVSELVLNIDLAPTLLEIANVDIPSSVQGRSWVSLLQGKGNWRESFLYEYYSENDYRPHGGSRSTPTILAVRSKNWKYITYPELDNELTELYQLSEDPNELNNLADDPNFSTALKKMQVLLATYLDPSEYTKPEQASIVYKTRASLKRSMKDQFCVWFNLFC